MHMCRIVTAISVSEYLEISYSSPQPNSDTFDHIVASVSPAGASARLIAPPGWVRRYAGLVDLNLPSTLYPPDTYSFISSDRQLEIKVAVHPPDQHYNVSTLRQDVLSDTQYGAVVSDMHSETLTAGYSGELLSYVLTTKDLPQDRVVSRPPSQNRLRRRPNS